MGSPPGADRSPSSFEDVENIADTATVSTASSTATVSQSLLCEQNAYKNALPHPPA